MVGVPVVDLAVEMPAALLERQDEANYRYHLKRAFYLATVAQALSGLPALRDPKTGWTWTPFRGHVSRPVLAITLAESRVQINVHIVLPRMHFAFGRLAPGTSMVRASAALDILSGEKGLRAGTLVEAPTPIYNSLILLDMLMVEHLKLIHAQCKSLPALREAIKLAKAWLQQWAPPNQAFGLSGFHLSMLAVYLARLGRLDPLMSELQLFKILLHFLADQEWQKPILFPGWTPPPECPLSIYQESFAAALVEPVAGMNILFDLSIEAVREVSRQARIALQILARDDYQSLFTQPQPRLAHFDSYFVVKQMHWMPDIQANLAHYQSQIVPENARLKMLARKLHQALGTRVKAIMISPIMTTSVPVKEEGKRPSPRPRHCITEYAIGLVWNGAEAQRLVELGPIASEDDTEARQFRQFWRGRSELRRFPDGSVREAVAWESFATKRYAIIPDIVTFILEAHFGTEHVESADLGAAFAWQSTRLLYGDLPDVLLRFSRVMKSINDLPLAVTRCEPISPAACLTLVLRLPTVGEVEQQGGSVGGEFAPVTEMLIYLEGSSRWPEEYYGFQYAKQAFAVQICQALQARFGLETSLTEAYFDVCMDGYVLRCHMHQEGELSLWHRQGLDPSEHLILHEERPRHCRAIAALSQGSLAYGVSCRLFKRWLSTKMYALQLPEPLLELLVAATFLSGQQPPQSALSGLVRVLELLTRHPWAEQPLLVDFEQRGGGEEEDRGDHHWSAETVLAVFEASAKAGNRPTMWIAPSYQGDGNCCIWSRRATATPQDLADLQRSAQQALDAINTLNPVWEELLVPDYGRFSLLAQIDLGDLHRHPKAAKLIASHARQRFMRALPGFDPIAALLKRLGHYCEREGLTLYYDLLNRGPMIGLVAKAGGLPDRHRSLVVAEEIRELAGGLISKVAPPQELLNNR